MPRCANKDCRAKLAKGTKPPLVCNDACQKASYQQKREAAIAKRKARVVKPKAKKKKLKSIARVRNDAADLLQKLVRMKAANADGFAKCVTCEKVLHWKELQGGHFIERGRGATKLLEENVHPQCPGCNKYGMKNASVVLTYRRYMVDMYGETEVARIERLAMQIAKPTREELEAMAFEFRRQIQQQESRLSGRTEQEEQAA